MHLLFISSIVPGEAPSSGYEIANAAIFQALQRAGARVTAIGFSWPGKAPLDPANTVVLGEIDPRNEAAGALTKLRWVAGAVASGLTVSSAKLRIVQEAQLEAAIAAARPFDAFVLNAVTLPGAFESVFSGRPRVFVAHNVEHRTARENAASAASPVERLLFAREARLLEALEGRLCAAADFVWTLAPEDCAGLGLEGSGRCAALPLIARAEAPPPIETTAEFDLGLIGNWTWQANRIGLEWFLGEVAPLLPADASIRVAGRAPAGLAARFPRADFVGGVPDAERFLRAARIVPLVSRAGTGVQLKTIEAFELGLPCVATQSAVRGIAALPGNCTVADDPVGFAAALAERLARARAGERLATDGRAFHAAQRAALDAAVARGLSGLTSSPEQAAA